MRRRKGKGRGRKRRGEEERDYRQLIFGCAAPDGMTALYKLMIDIDIHSAYSEHKQSVSYRHAPLIHLRHIKIRAVEIRFD